MHRWHRTWRKWQACVHTTTTNTTTSSSSNTFTSTTCTSSVSPPSISTTGESREARGGAASRVCGVACLLPHVRRASTHSLCYSAGAYSVLTLLFSYAVRRRLPEHFYTHDPATGTQLVRHSDAPRLQPSLPTPPTLRATRAPPRPLRHALIRPLRDALARMHVEYAHTHVHVAVVKQEDIASLRTESPAEALAALPEPVMQVG